MYSLKVVRRKASYNYMIDHTKPESWANNANNNCLDDIELMNDGKIVFTTKCQSVSNHPIEGAPGATIEPGTCNVRLFADVRKFHVSVHEILGAKLMDGRVTDNKAMCGTAGRWLIHDKFWVNRITPKAWSAGCIVIDNRAGLDKALKAAGFKSGDVIPMTIVEI